MPVHLLIVPAQNRRFVRKAEVVEEEAACAEESPLPVLPKQGKRNMQHQILPQGVLCPGRLLNQGAVRIVPTPLYLLHGVFRIHGADQIQNHLPLRSLRIQKPMGHPAVAALLCPCPEGLPQNPVFCLFQPLSYGFQIQKSAAFLPVSRKNVRQYPCR